MRAGGRERSYQAKPPTRTSGEQRRGGDLPAHRACLPRPPRPARAQRARPPAPAVIAPGAPRMRATSVAKYQPPERISAAAPSAISSPSPSSTTRVGERAPRTRRRGWRPDRGAPLGELAEPARPAPPCGRGPCPASARRGRRAPAARRPRRPGHHDREREPLALAAGEVARVARRPPSSRPTASSAPPTGLAGKLVADALAHEQVARALRQQRAAAGGVTVPRTGSSSPAAARSSVLLPAPLRPISATRSPGSIARSRPRRTSRGPPPSSSSTQRSRSSSAARARSPAPAALRRASRCVGLARLRGAERQPQPQRGPRLLDRRPAAAPSPARSNSRAPGGRERRGRLSSAHSQQIPRAGRRTRSARRHRSDHAVGGREAALEPVLGEHAPPSPTPRSAGAAARSARRPRPGRAARSARRAAPAAGAGRARRPARPAAARRRRACRSARSSRCGDRERQRHLLDRARPGGRRLAAHLERQLELGAHGGRDDLRLGVLRRRGPPAPPSSAGPCSRTSRPAHLEPRPRPRRRGSGERARSRRAAASSCRIPERPARTTNSPSARSRGRRRAAPALAALGVAVARDASDR